MGRTSWSPLATGSIDAGRGFSHAGLASAALLRVELDPGAPEEVDRTAWPFTMPAVAQLIREGIDFAPGITFLVGGNGAGKSTLVEEIAMAYGLSPEGESRNAGQRNRPSE